MKLGTADWVSGCRWFGGGAAVVLSGLLCGGGLLAQVVPATPKKWGTRSVSGGGSASVEVEEVERPAPRKVREVTYVVLSPERVFRSNDGKPLSGKVVAFEQTVAVREERPGDQPGAAGGRVEGVAPPVAKPTVMKDGKVRLLVNSKLFEVSLGRLSAEDRKFVEELRARVEGTPPEEAGKDPAKQAEPERPPAAP